MNPDEMPIPSTPPRKTLNSKSEDSAQEIQEAQKKIATCFDRLAKTPDGLFALQTIFNLSGVNLSSLILTTQHDVSTNILLVKQGRASIWNDLRQYLSRESLILIEYPQTKGN